MEQAITKSICVFSASSDAIHQVFFDDCQKLGKQMAEKNYTLVYGGTTIGLMGAVAKSVSDHGGKVIGIIPEVIHQMGIANELADELIITKDLRERKALMDMKSDIFLALPGGFGTLEEVLEVITLKQLRFHTKPIIFLNTNGFYDPLQELFEHIFREKFAKADYRGLYYIAPDVTSVFAYLDTYQPIQLPEKVFRK